jgi:hypothetical protein
MFCQGKLAATDSCNYKSNFSQKHCEIIIAASQAQADG